MTVTTAHAAEEGGPAARSQRALAMLQEVTGVPGMSAAVWSDGDLVWSGAAGHLDLEKRHPATEESVFRFASVSKIFAATATAKLAEEGKLDIDAPVQTFVSGLNPDWPPITARQLAANISGIPHYQDGDEALGRKSYKSAIESLETFKDRALLFPPGTDYNYSTFGFTLLSAAVEAKAGRPYLDFLGETVTKELAIGRDRTGEDGASDAFEYGAAGLFEAPPVDYSYSWGGAGLGGTAPALARFGGRLLAGEIVKPETFAWMTKPALKTDGEPAAERAFEVGFGWRISADATGARTVHHAGVTAGARSALVLHPEANVAAAILTNAPWVASIEATTTTLAAPFLRDFDAAEAPCPVRTRRYDGVFNGAAVSGAARFRIDGGVCVGDVSIDGAMADWLNGFPQGDAQALHVIAYDKGDGFSGGAIITPIGAFEISRTPGGAYAARIGASRDFKFTLH